MDWIRFAFIRLAALICLPSMVAAQQYYGTLTGTVTDTSGAVLPNVAVTATSLHQGTAATAVSNARMTAAARII